MIEAESADAAMAVAKKRATVSIQLLEVAQVENGAEGDGSGDAAGTAARKS